MSLSVPVLTKNKTKNKRADFRDCWPPQKRQCAKGKFLQKCVVRNTSKRKVNKSCSQTPKRCTAFNLAPHSTYFSNAVLGSRSARRWRLCWPSRRCSSRRHQESRRPDKADGAAPPYRLKWTPRGFGILVEGVVAHVAGIRCGLMFATPRVRSEVCEKEVVVVSCR